MSEWTYIKKGDRRPEGRVLVAYVDDRAYVTIANWNKGKSVWVTDHWYIRTVYAWMPLPALPAEASDEQ